MKNVFQIYSTPKETFGVRLVMSSRTCHFLLYSHSFSLPSLAPLEKMSCPPSAEIETQNPLSHIENNKRAELEKSFLLGLCSTLIEQRRGRRYWLLFIHVGCDYRTQWWSYLIPDGLFEHRLSLVRVEQQVYEKGCIWAWSVKKYLTNLPLFFFFFNL